MLSFLLSLCLLFKKIGKRQNRFCLETMAAGGGERGWEAVGRDGPNNVYTHKKMNTQ
jgi:hypothetical protein